MYGLPDLWSHIIYALIFINFCLQHLKQLRSHLCEPEGPDLIICVLDIDCHVIKDVR